MDWVDGHEEDCGRAMMKVSCVVVFEVQGNSLCLFTATLMTEPEYLAH